MMIQWFWLEIPKFQVPLHGNWKFLLKEVRNNVAHIENKCFYVSSKNKVALKLKLFLSFIKNLFLEMNAISNNNNECSVLIKYWNLSNNLQSIKMVMLLFLVFFFIQWRYWTKILFHLLKLKNFSSRRNFNFPLSSLQDIMCCRENILFQH